MKVGKQNLERTQISQIKGLSKQMPSSGDGRGSTWHAQGPGVTAPWQKEKERKRNQKGEINNK
jgi:hypothetical protein